MTRVWTLWRVVTQPLKAVGQPEARAVMLLMVA